MPNLQSDIRFTKIRLFCFRQNYNRDFHSASKNLLVNLSQWERFQAIWRLFERLNLIAPQLRHGDFPKHKSAYKVHFRLKPFE